MHFQDDGCLSASRISNRGRCRQRRRCRRNRRCDGVKKIPRCLFVSQPNPAASRRSCCMRKSTISSCFLRRSSSCSRSRFTSASSCSISFSCAPSGPGTAPSTAHAIPARLRRVDAAKITPVASGIRLPLGPHLWMLPHAEQFVDLLLPWVGTRDGAGPAEAPLCGDTEMNVGTGS